MRFIVHIWPRKGQLDPQGTAIHHSLSQLGFKHLKSVEHGKQIAVTFDHPSEQENLNQLEKICSDILVNPITEDYKIHRSDDLSSS